MRGRKEGATRSSREGIYNLTRWSAERYHPPKPSSFLTPKHQANLIDPASIMKFTTATLLALVPLALAAPAHVARENWDKEHADDSSKGWSPCGTRL